MEAALALFEIATELGPSIRRNGFHTRIDLEISSSMQIAIEQKHTSSRTSSTTSLCLTQSTYT
jgi:hypothetical protein